ncbi:hypothetical protein PsorP6_004081 [Peronosclerospora sorghi]|uniref:Uncharacterized protein n=1 Tax=Peronosclerospora sorghi TaxID=230839 RepID=A0ACC0VQS9_9STRA|nr:hypothetical protein PsorP6_004081 [Peronosclerospora sorghi]
MSAPFSRSQTYPQIEISPYQLRSQVTNGYGSPVFTAVTGKTFNERSPPQLAILRFWREEKYISIHLKGLSVDPKINNKTLHIWHILHRLHGRKKTKFLYGH